MEKILNEIAAGQRRRLLDVARRIVPQVTEDDLLQPNDYQELETHPEFRYEEGVLHGIEVVCAALRSCQQGSK